MPRNYILRLPREKPESYFRFLSYQEQNAECQNMEIIEQYTAFAKKEIHSFNENPQGRCKNPSAEELPALAGASGANTWLL